MGLNVLSKLKEAMLGELDGLDVNHGSQAKRRRDTILGGEAVYPERHSINNLAPEDTWDAAI